MNGFFSSEERVGDTSLCLITISNAAKWTCHHILRPHARLSWVLKNILQHPAVAVASLQRTAKDADVIENQWEGRLQCFSFGLNGSSYSIICTLAHKWSSSEHVSQQRDVCYSNRWFSLTHRPFPCLKLTLCWVLYIFGNTPFWGLAKKCNFFLLTSASVETLSSERSLAHRKALKLSSVMYTARSRNLLVVG